MVLPERALMERPAPAMEDLQCVDRNSFATPADAGQNGHHIGACGFSDWSASDHHAGDLFVVRYLDGVQADCHEGRRFGEATGRRRVAHHRVEGIAHAMVCENCPERLLACVRERRPVTRGNHAGEARVVVAFCVDAESHISATTREDIALYFSANHRCSLQIGMPPSA